MFELEDQPWFPAFLRRMQVEYIGWLVMAFRVYRPLAPILADELSQARTRRVLDIGSGHGGPIMDLARCRELLGVDFMLSDLYPSPRDTGSANITWHGAPLDAMAPDAPEGFRTMFNAYHHFSEAGKRALIQVHGTKGFLVAELLRPGLLCFFQILLVTTVGQVLLCPFVKPFRWERLLFTWVIPINLITVMWDGLVSVIRVDGPRTLDVRAREFAPAGTHVVSGVSGPWWAPVSWFAVIPSRP